MNPHVGSRTETLGQEARKCRRGRGAVLRLTSILGSCAAAVVVASDRSTDGFDPPDAFGVDVEQSVGRGGKGETVCDGAWEPPGPVAGVRKRLWAPELTSAAAQCECVGHGHGQQRNRH